MRLVVGVVLSLLCAFAVGRADADQGVYPKTDEELRAAYDALTWRAEAGSYKLPASHALIQLPKGDSLLLGVDAERYSWLDGGVEFPGTEAVLVSESDAKSLVYYEWRDEGYVDDSDWEDVDDDELLKQYSDSTEAGNDKRAKNGFEPMHIVGWLESPHYDKATRTVTYAMELKDRNGNWANVVALRLGRAGYTQLTWVGSIESVQSATGRPALLDQALAMHAFESGYRYQDFKDGDKVAAYGIAGLVAAALGVKIGKGLFAAALAKVAIPAVAVVAYVIMRFKQLFLSFRWRS